ncbi:MAG: lipoprotein-releasing system permease protein [Flavobacterium sp.]|jgi:lipoprotein-releasing system permease protein
MVSTTNLKIAFAHLTSRPKQTFVAILSVLFGVSMYIFMNGFMGGVNEMQTEMTFSSLAHIRIYNEVDTKVKNLIIDDENTVTNVRNAKAIQYSNGIKNATKIMDELKNNKNIIAMTSQVNLNGTFKNGSVEVIGQISGIDVVNENRMFGMKRYVISGNWDDLARSNNNIVIGIEMAKKLNLALNDLISITTTSGIIKNYSIVCILKTGLKGVDGTKVFIKKSAALQLTSNNRNYASDIQINIPDFNKATTLSNSLKGITYKVESWQQSNGQIVASTALRNIIALAVSIVILIVAAFGIYNIMNMTVNEKIKEIAILKALGFGGKDVIQIFLTQAIVIGLFGGLFGVGLGYIIASAVSNVPFQMPGIDTMPMLFNVSDYITAFLFGLLLTVLAGYLPAKKAANLDPVSIFRE